MSRHLMPPVLVALVLSLVSPKLVAVAGRAEAEQAPYIYAIQHARLVPVSGPVVESGTIVFRDGLITAVGADVLVPVGAQIIQGKGLTVYPGLIDMGTTTGLDMPPVPRAENPQTTEDIERVKADYLLRAHFRAADHVNPTASAFARVAAAGITSVLATPSGDAIRGQSALVNTALPPDEPQIGAIADERKGAMIVRTPVALHITFSERPGGGGGYPNSLMGVIAFVRQSFIDAQYYGAREVGRDFSPATTNAGASAKRANPSERVLIRPYYEPAWEAMQPALAGRQPVAFRGQAAREILRALDMAKNFKLDPIITDGREADQVTTDLKNANARVIVSLNYPTRPETLAPDADEALSVLRSRANAPRVPAALQKAGIVFAFESAGLSEAKDFIKNAAKAVQNGLARDDAIKALTLNAATIAGAADRLGSLDAGKIANLLVTEGDVFDEKMTIKHVFVDGRQVNLDLPPDRSQTNRRGGQ